MIFGNKPEDHDWPQEPKALRSSVWRTKHETSYMSPHKHIHTPGRKNPASQPSLPNEPPKPSATSNNHPIHLLLSRSSLGTAPEDVSTGLVHPHKGIAGSNEAQNHSCRGGIGLLLIRKTKLELNQHREQWKLKRGVVSIPIQATSKSMWQCVMAVSWAHLPTYRLITCSQASYVQDSIQLKCKL